MKKIAVLGATGYIGKSLVYKLILKKNYEIFLFARSTKKLKDFLKLYTKYSVNKVKKIDDFRFGKYDVVINCVGIGDPKKMKEAGYELFEITEKFDNLIINYLKINPKTVYINLSSGAVYGKSIEKPIHKKSLLVLDINNVDQGDCYTVTKINCEAKHRAIANLNIIDIRLFSFFSRFIELENSGFLLSHIINSINKKRTFYAISTNFIRDFINPEDLLRLIELIIKKGKINDFFDAYSKKPISFFKLLKFFEKNYGLKYKFKDDLKLVSPTGPKNSYFSSNKKAVSLGYIPTYSSLGGIAEEVKYLIKQFDNEPF